MPALELFSDPLDVQNLPSDGNLLLDPPLPGLNWVLLRRLSCLLRVAPIPGVKRAILDPCTPLTVFPHCVWHNDFRWQAGPDYDELSVAAIGRTLQGQVFGQRFSCRLAQLRVPVVLAGRNLKDDRLRLDSLVCLLADPGSMPFIILGLWGGAFVGSRLAVEKIPGSDDLQARPEF